MAQQAHPRARVLLAGDHAAVRQAFAAPLVDERLSVRAKPEGAGAALADLLPGENGGPALLADPHRLGIPLIVCPSHKDPEHARPALAAGARAIRETLVGWVVVCPRAADDPAEDP